MLFSNSLYSTSPTLLIMTIYHWFTFYKNSDWWSTTTKGSNNNNDNKNTNTTHHHHGHHCHQCHQITPTRILKRFRHTLEDWIESSVSEVFFYNLDFIIIYLDSHKFHLIMYHPATTISVSSGSNRVARPMNLWIDPHDLLYINW